MEWKKLGLVYKVDSASGHEEKRIMVPTPILINNDVIRVFVTICDFDDVGRVHYFDLDANDPCQVVGRSKAPVLDIGKPSTFDEHGVVVGHVIQTQKNVLRMYYSGFQRFSGAQYKIFMGIAESYDGGESFTRLKETPILGESQFETLFRCAPFVIKDGEIYKMWYVGGSGWELVENKKVPRYSLKYIESNDGLEWGEKGLSCFEMGSDEHGIGRPWVILEGENYELYYSIRVISIAAYRLGFATSKNGIDWVRKDQELRLNISDDSFDSNAISYSAVLDVKGQRYCFYNGNGFGRDGFAVAKLL